MKRIKLSALLLVAALGIAAVGSAALSSISFDRSVSAGQVLLDTDPNVAVQITNISNYPGLVKADTDGKVSFYLNEGINNNSNSGFNTDANYSIGTATSGVIKIKNNSDKAVAVTLTNDANNANAIALMPVNGSASTIAVGGSGDYYFTLNTFGQDAVKDLKATLSVNGQ